MIFIIPAVSMNKSHEIGIVLQILLGFILEYGNLGFSCSLDKKKIALNV